MDGKNKKTIVIFIISLFFYSWSVLAITQIDSLGFKVENGQGRFTVDAKGPLKFAQQDFQEERQIVLDIADAKLSKKASRPLDTSSFDSVVTMISPYQLDSPPNQVRIVIQLREYVRTNIQDTGSGLLVSIGNNPTQAEGSPPQDKPAEQQSENNQPQSQEQKTGEEASLEQFEKSQNTQKFVGSPITLQVKDTDVTDVLRLIGEASGFNIIVSPGVSGKISLSLIEVPWDQVLDVVLQTMKLGAERSNNILRIMTLGELTSQKQEQLQAKLAQQASAPRVTRVFPISYADLGGIQTVLTTFGRTVAAAGAGAAAASSTVVQADQRTNSLIVQDTQENVERMKKLIEILDTPTPQVLIEAKIVEASERFTNSVSGRVGLGFGSSVKTFAFMSFNAANPTDSLVGTPGVFSAGSSIADISKQGAAFGASPTVGFLPGVYRINALLQLAETEDEAKVIASPKIVVLHKESASIIQSKPVALPTTVSTATATTTQVSISQANTSLTVTPTVTNDESILMVLNVSRDTPQTAAGAQAQAVANRNISTKVLVENGSTLVIGGVHSMDTSNSSSGFPFLRKIPIIGAFFGNRVKENSRSELLIFVTPKILNVKRNDMKS